LYLIIYLVSNFFLFFPFVGDPNGSNKLGCEAEAAPSLREQPCHRARRTGLQIIHLSSEQ